MRKRLPQNQIDVVEAHERDKRIKLREQQRRVLFIENVLEISLMHSTQQYKAILGFSPPPKWSAYLGQLEIFYTRSEIDRWRRIVQTLVQGFNIPITDLVEVPSTRLRDIMNLTNDETEAKELVMYARQQTPGEWRLTVREKKGLPMPDECNHPHNTQYRVCEDCGQKNVQP